jgi:RPN1 N-terminal domain
VTALCATEVQLFTQLSAAVICVTCAHSLEYKLAGNVTELGQWGHEYLRSLAGQIGQEYTARVTKIGAAAAPAGADAAVVAAAAMAEVKLACLCLLSSVCIIAIR